MRSPVLFLRSWPNIRSNRTGRFNRAPVHSDKTTKAGNESSLVINGLNDELTLAARLLLATLFLIFGWRKLTDFSGTVSQMVQLGVPVPVLAAAVATFMELPVAFAIAIGALTRLCAVLMFFYTLGTALIGHRYWTMTGTDRVDSMDSFYKNLSIMGGFLLLYIIGAGKYSIDALCGISAP
jgi:putative oxidoreductase